MAWTPGPSEYRNLLEGIYDAVLITDLKGSITDFNLRAGEVLGGRPRDWLGRNIVEFIPVAAAGGLGAIHKRLEEQAHVIMESRCTPPGGAAFPAEVAVSRFPMAGTPRLAFFIRDISAHKEAAETALADARERLEQHDRARLQFISNVSHELRTPLTSMTYAINNMISGVVGPVPDRVRRYLEILDADCRRLLSTVNDILDLRKIETSTLSLAKRRIPLARLVQRSAESLRVQAQQKAQALNILTGPGRWFVECDAAKMERVIINVVGNAIKFTPTGGSIVVTLDDDPGQPDRVLLSIRDSGIGIPKEALGKVTLRYFTVGEQPTGSGLGLAISKEIITLHGGRIDICSPPPGHEEGTLVTISLPVTAPPLVLLVDDDEGILAFLEDQVTRQGYRVVKARGGKEAMEFLRRQRPDVVILDLVLPDFDGTELILKMKSDKTLASISVIVVTGAAIGRGKAEILQSFAIPTLAKPWQEAELLDHVAGTFFGNANPRRPAAQTDDHAMPQE